MCVCVCSYLLFHLCDATGYRRGNITTRRKRRTVDERGILTSHVYLVGRTGIDEMETDEKATDETEIDENGAHIP